MKGVNISYWNWILLWKEQRGCQEFMKLRSCKASAHILYLLTGHSSLFCIRYYFQCDNAFCFHWVLKMVKKKIIIIIITGLVVADHGLLLEMPCTTKRVSLVQWWRSSPSTNVYQIPKFNVCSVSKSVISHVWSSLITPSYLTRLLILLLIVL